MIKATRSPKRVSPWAWIPSLYFAEGIPYVIVMTIAVVMYKRLGVSNTDAALYTSWLYLPWVIKPFWSPLVDLIKTKRWWIWAMQLLIGAALAGIAFTLNTSPTIQATLAFFLAYSIQQRHARHCSRRVLHARARHSRPGTFRGHTLNVLPDCHYFRTRIAYSRCRIPGTLHAQGGIRLESYILRRGWPVHRPVPVS